MKAQKETSNYLHQDYEGNGEKINGTHSNSLSAEPKDVDKIEDELVIQGIIMPSDGGYGWVNFVSTF
jgi:hypothetical protein